MKFRHTYDPKDMGRMEYKYNEVARKCGINVPDYKLLDGKYFASKRFDIENGNDYTLLLLVRYSMNQYQIQTRLQGIVTLNRIFDTRFTTS